MRPRWVWPAASRPGLLIKTDSLALWVPAAAGMTPRTRTRRKRQTPASSTRRKQGAGSAANVRGGRQVARSPDSAILRSGARHAGWAWRARAGGRPVRQRRRAGRAGCRRRGPPSGLARAWPTPGWPRGVRAAFPARQRCRLRSRVGDDLRYRQHAGDRGGSGQPGPHPRPGSGPQHMVACIPADIARSWQPERQNDCKSRQAICATGIPALTGLRLCQTSSMP